MKHELQSLQVEQSTPAMHEPPAPVLLATVDDAAVDDAAVDDAAVDELAEAELGPAPPGPAPPALALLPPIPPVPVALPDGPCDVDAEPSDVEPPDPGPKPPAAEPEPPLPETLLLRPHPDSAKKLKITK